MELIFKDVGDCIVIYGTGMGSPPVDAKKDCVYGVLHYGGYIFVADPMMDYFSFNDMKQIVAKMGEMRP